MLLMPRPPASRLRRIASQAHPHPHINCARFVGKTAKHSYILFYLKKLAMADLLKGLFGGKKSASSPIPSPDDAGSFKLHCQTIREKHH